VALAEYHAKDFLRKMVNTSIQHNNLKIKVSDTKVKCATPYLNIYIKDGII
jgi:hypothetical protein